MFISRYRIYATPTLLFLDPSGRRIADSLVGYNGADAYRALVTERLVEAELMLEAADGPSTAAVARTHP